MKNLTLFLTLLLIPSFLNAAPRVRPSKNICSSCPLMRTTVPMPDNQRSVTERERDHQIFTNCVGILVNFVKLFMDPHNVPEAKQNAHNILDGINNLAHVITRGQMMTSQMEEELLKYFIAYCQEQVWLEETVL